MIQQFRLKPNFKLQEEHFKDGLFLSFDNLISAQLLTEGKLYQLEIGITMYDPQTFEPRQGYLIICNDKNQRRLPKEVVDEFFQPINEWREEQLNKIID
jgi:hypothetical protein